MTNIFIFLIAFFVQYSFSDRLCSTLLCEEVEGIERPGSMIDMPSSRYFMQTIAGICFCRVVVVACDQKQDTPFKVARLRCGRVGFEFPATVQLLASSNSNP